MKIHNNGGTWKYICVKIYTYPCNLAFSVGTSLFKTDVLSWANVSMSFNYKRQRHRDQCFTISINSIYYMKWYDVDRRTKIGWLCAHELILFYYIHLYYKSFYFILSNSISVRFISFHYIWCDYIISLNLFYFISFCILPFFFFIILTFKIINQFFFFFMSLTSLFWEAIFTVHLM